MCPNCRAFITTADKVCPYCDLELGPSYRERSADVAGLIPRERFTTVAILLVNSGLYAAMIVHALRVVGSESLVSFPLNTLLEFGAKNPIAISYYGQWWRFVTAGFLHAGLLHFAMNSWVLMDLGRQVEEFFGTARYLTIYFVSSVAGFVASYWWSPSNSVGASAAIYGLIGAMIGLGLRSSTPLGGQLREHFGRWAVYGVATSFIPGIDMAAHLGGLVAGIALGYIADRPKLGNSVINKMWKFAAVACVIITFCSFAIVVAGMALRQG